MSSTKNSFSSLIAQFLRLQKNSLEIINKLNDVTTSSKDSVGIELLKDDNTTESIQVPSIGFLKSEINRLDSNIKSLSGLEDNKANIRNADGTVSKIYQATVLKDPSSPSSLQVPATFQARNNWFFESFLNPLLYIEINVENQIPDNSHRVYVKRIIANTQSDVQKQYFDSNLKGRNDITDTDYISALNSQGIQYFIDEQINDLDLRTIRFTGSFGVLRIFDEDVQSTVNGVTTTSTVRKYKLNSLKYTDTIANSTNTKTLSKGDLLITPGSTKYEITSVDVTNQTIILKRLFGFDAIKIGDSALTIYSNVLSNRQVEINVGFDEREAVFIKSIDGDFNIASTKYSPGICFYTNELQINTSDGVKTLSDFYNSQVSDFGKIFIASAKENTIPSVYGQTPSTPTVSPDNFKVVVANQQVTDSKEGQNFNDKIKLKTTLKNEVDSIDKSIDQTRKQLANITTSSAGQVNVSEFKKLNDKLQTLTKDKATRVDLLGTTINEINNLVNTTPELKEAPKYRVRGFWPVPEPIFDSKTGNQNVIQFNVRYRYLSMTGNPTGVKQIDYVDNNGTQKTGQFSNWIQFKGEVRKKVYDNNTGTYIWKVEDVSDANTVNINQLDIPITKGERVEIQIQSISEAGWPNNPLISEWSTSSIVDFPSDLSVSVDNSQYILQNNADLATNQINTSLQAKGLDQHLSTQFTSGDKFYAHNSNTIASGFFDGAGKAIDLFQKITQIDNELQSLRALVARAKGTLGVYLRSGSTSNKVNNGSTVNLFAGYYDQLIDLTNPSNKGKISTVTYYIELRNEAATPLELSSLIPGGQGVKAPLSVAGQNDYNNNRKYGNTPIQLSGIVNSAVNTTTPGEFIQTNGYQSANAYSQFVYPRYKSVGLDTDLYLTPNNGITSPLPWNANTGTNTGSGNVPINNYGIITPYNPTPATSPVGDGVNSSVWDGNYGAGNIPTGNGNLNEFCIHVSHPDINEITSAPTFAQLVAPTVIAGNPMKYPAFRHALGFETDTNSNTSYSLASNQSSYLQQLEYYPATGTAFSAPNSYPNKLGFINSDEFLCGKYSCGAYLFLSPTNHTAVQIEGSTQLAKKTLEFGQENAITIPLVFQMRAQDKLGYVGGWRSAGNIKNITYTKKVGIDIQVKNEELFSFDVLVTGSYTKTSLVSPAYSQTMITAKTQ
jgi:hypothetical protein